MTETPEMFALGRTLKPHGLKGDVAVKLDVDAPSEYRDLNMVWVSQQGSMVPYTVTMVSVRPKVTVFHFEGTDDVEGAKAMSGRGLFLPVDILPGLSGLKFYYHEVIGFDLVDLHHGNLGKIKQVLDLPGNPLFQTVLNGVEGLFPMTDEVLCEVNREGKTITVQLPDGLYELYFSAAEK